MIRSMRRQLRAWRQEFLAVWGRLRSFHRVALGITLSMCVMLGGRPYLYDALKAAVRDKRETLKKMDAPETISTPENDPDLQELQLRIEGLEGGMGARRKERQQAIAAWPPFNTAEKGAIVAKFDELITKAGLERIEFRDAPLVVALAGADRDPAAAARAKAEKERREKAEREKAEKAKAKADADAAKADAGKSDAGKSDKSKASKAKTERPKPKAAFETVVHGYVLAGSFSAVRTFLEAADKFGYPAQLDSVCLELADSESADAAAQRNPVIRLSFNLKLYLHD